MGGFRKSSPHNFTETPTVSEEESMPEDPRKKRAETEQEDLKPKMRPGSRRATKGMPVTAYYEDMRLTAYLVMLERVIRVFI